MKTITALFMFLLLVSATAQSGEVIADLTRTFRTPFGGGVAFNAASDDSTGAVLNYTAATAAVFLAIDCKITVLEITADHINCEIAGHWASSPGFSDYPENTFGIDRCCSKEEWKALCAQFQRWKGRRATFSIHCKTWSSHGGYVIFGGAETSVRFGTEKPELADFIVSAEILRPPRPAFAIAGSAGWAFR